MHHPRTVQIRTPNGPVTINEEDYDPKVHTLHKEDERERTTEDDTPKPVELPEGTQPPAGSQELIATSNTAQANSTELTQEDAQDPPAAVAQTASIGAGVTGSDTDGGTDTSLGIVKPNLDAPAAAPVQAVFHTVKIGAKFYVIDTRTNQTVDGKSYKSAEEAEDALNTLDPNK